MAAWEDGGVGAVTHFEQQQEAMARWMGYPDAAAMNQAHDAAHEALCRWLGVPSHSLACARGEPFDPELAGIEEDAVLRLQRFMAHHKVGVPQ